MENKRRRRKPAILPNPIEVYERDEDGRVNPIPKDRCHRNCKLNREQCIDGIRWWANKARKAYDAQDEATAQRMIGCYAARLAEVYSMDDDEIEAIIESI